jgi:hypothetical protein
VFSHEEGDISIVGYSGDGELRDRFGIASLFSCNIGKSRLAGKRKANAYSPPVLRINGGKSQEGSGCLQSVDSERLM